PEDRAVIFDRFSRGSRYTSGGRFSGTGLGLALVAEHVRLHGGSVRVTDPAGGAAGACFTVTLPVAEL
ncbi:MAG: HAMP domain-containing histidine kinase, partial [Acidimicrobiia bacterium]|nr:HAMP domain-containing histidine kinase [Acidimicrobiia bacterium]